MWSRLFALVFAAWLIFSQVAPITAQEQQAQPNSDERIQKAIDRLGADYEEAEAAERELLRLVGASDPRLIAAAASMNVTTAGRARIILRELNRRELESAKHMLPWEDLVKRIAGHAESGDWKTPGWRDEVIEGALRNMLDQINPHVPSDPLTLPSKIAGDVDERRMGQLRSRRETSLLYVGRGTYKASYSDQEVLLIDGSVHLGMASNSIIIATGGVNIGHCRGCIVIAGEFVRTEHEGMSSVERPRNGQEVRRRSLVMSGGPSQGGGTGSVRYSPFPTRYGTDLVLVNSRFERLPLAAPLRGAPPVIVENVKLAIVPKAMPNKLKDRLKIKQVYEEQGPSSPAFLILDQGGVETILRSGVEIRDNYGKPIPALAGWKLELISEHASEDYALFSNGKEYAGFVLESSHAKAIQAIEARRARP